MVNRLECNTCPYQYILTKKFYERKEFARKEREDVFGGPGAWDNADKMEVQCPKDGCDGALAAFFQVQIRSADEPMTSFYKVRALAYLSRYQANVRSAWLVETDGERIEKGQDFIWEGEGMALVWQRKWPGSCICIPFSEAYRGAAFAGALREYHFFSIYHRATFQITPNLNKRSIQFLSVP